MHIITTKRFYTMFLYHVYTGRIKMFHRQKKNRNTKESRMTTFTSDEVQKKYCHFELLKVITATQADGMK